MKDAGEDLQALKKSDVPSRYERLSSVRWTYLDRARDCSKLTIPAIFPPDGHTPETKFYRPYQSIGARGVNNLANKLLLSLLPPNTSFFKLSADDATIAELSDETARARVEEKFNEIERAVQTRVETMALRAPLITALKELIIGGNTLVVFPKNGGVRIIGLENYVVRRNNVGEVLEVIYKESARYEDLPEDVRRICKGNNDLPSSDNDNGRKEVDIYTVYELTDGQYKTYQVVKNFVIPDTTGAYPKAKAPFIALRWAHEDNSDYGRSYVEEYIGDLQSAEGLSKAILESSAAAAKVVIMVRSTGTTEEDDVANAENLDVITGDEADVSMLQLNKQADMQVANGVLNDILQRLSYAFLMNTAVQRNAERVTAEEIREMIKELEDALGGAYALFAQELQLPLVKIVMNELVKEQRIPDLEGLKKQGIEVEPQITTGVEAIGRGYDLGKLRTFMGEFIAPLGEVGMAEINYGDFLKRAGTALGIDMDGLVKSEEQKTQEREATAQQQQQALIQQTMADAAKQASGPVAKAVTEQGTQANG